MLTIGASLHIPSILMSMFSWSSFYFSLRHLEPQRKAEWHCRTVTAVHAMLITAVTAWSSFIQGPWPFTDAGGPNTPLQVTAATICLGYFLFDFAWCIYFQTEGLTMLLHHMLSILGFVWTLCAGKYGTELVATICGSEVTNPLLQLRWFLKETGRYNTILGEVVDFLFMLSFFLVRIGVGSVLLYCYFQQPTDLTGRVGALLIYLISWIFWINIFQFAVYKYKKKYHARRLARRQNPSTSTSAKSELDQQDDSAAEQSETERLMSNGKSCHSTASGHLLTNGVSHSDVHHRSRSTVHVGCSGTSDIRGPESEEVLTNGNAKNS